MPTPARYFQLLGRAAASLEGQAYDPLTASSDGLVRSASIRGMSDEVVADLSAGDGKSVPLLSFVSHIEGKNARVSVWPDRVEWDRKGILSTGAKAGIAVMTMGASYLATGVTRKQSTEVIPVKSIMSVTTKRGLGLQTKLSVITAGNTIEMRIAHKEAEQVRGVLMQLASGTHPSQSPSAAVVPPAAPAPVQAAPDLTAQLQQLKSLRDAGILTEEEFVAKKADILARL
ncbi:SHOCT domain-containing protein [Microbacterium hominis]|uniref:SHOCT domain-containing protein n=1 Tax=Microbacterium hominis TaxID=162426 RepID=UPI001CC2809C|nr:SHOCT domain-containing protein [Microbacterium hominis]